jgi:electron transport complex protein RnfA
MPTITFILVIASLVQIVEIILKKVSPSLYQALEFIYLLLLPTVLFMGTAILAVTKITTIQSLVYAISTALGFTLAVGINGRHS